MTFKAHSSVPLLAWLWLGRKSMVLPAGCEMRCEMGCEIGCSSVEWMWRCCYPPKSVPSQEATQVGTRAVIKSTHRPWRAQWRKGRKGLLLSVPAGFIAASLQRRPGIEDPIQWSVQGQIWGQGPMVCGHRGGTRAMTYREYRDGQSEIPQPIGKLGKENPLELGHIWKIEVGQAKGPMRKAKLR